MIQTKATGDDGAEKSGEHLYQPEDCRVEHLGEITLKDGRIFMGAIVTFPVSPPRLPISVVWNGDPVRMVLRTNVDLSDEPARPAVSMNQTSKHEVKP